MLNKIVVMGRLVRDPELRRTQSGIPVTTLRVAVDRDFKSQDGTRQADFFDVVAWRNTAEFVSKYFSKGRMIVVDGRLQSRDWEDRDGNKRVSIDIVAENVYFGDSKRESGGDYGGPPPYGTAPYGAPSGGYSGASGGYNAAPGYSSASSGYETPPASTPAPSEFAELDEDDGDLPF